LESGIVIPPALLFLLRIALAIWDLFCIHMNFRIGFSISMETDIRPFMGMALNLSIS
jgi:hypothetical protein